MLTIILAGGQSRRMGRDKALLEVDGKPMALVLAQRYLSLGPVALSVDRPGRFVHGVYPEYIDRYPGKGPLNGLYSAFCDSSEELVFLTATDMPNGAPDVVFRMRELMGEHDACVIEHENGRVEPLFGLYRRTCLSAVKDCLERDELSFRALFSRVRVRRVDKAELSPWDIQKMLMNLNTPEDFLDFQAAKQGG
ncbi:MAG: molybdenum cofactor guanylyltransferase [Clostridia bacterium]|nr:molybdenum cofactor guanylyltransferase [Clostridia bacterium]